MRIQSKTTLAGIITAVGVALSASQFSPVLSWVGDGLVILGTLLLGKSAEDKK